MAAAVFLFNIAQLFLIIGLFYYAIFYRIKKKINESDDDGGLSYDDWPKVVLPPIEGIDYPSEMDQQHFSEYE